MEEAIKKVYDAVAELGQYSKELNRKSNCKLKRNLLSVLCILDTYCAEDIRDLCREKSAYEKNKESILEWRKNNLEKFNEYQRNYQRRKALKKREPIFNTQENVNCQ